MQTKRLTLTEYRQQNALWLANELFNYKIALKTIEEHENFIIRNYMNYLLMFGSIKYDEEIKRKGEYLTEAEIEAHIESKEAPIEHCHH